MPNLLQRNPVRWRRSHPCAVAAADFRPGAVLAETQKGVKESMKFAGKKKAGCSVSPAMAQVGGE
jgi:hypothetical protein